MSDSTDTGTAPGTDAGNTGGGAPKDAPASGKVYSQEEFDTAAAKLRRGLTAEVSQKADRAWLEKLGLQAPEELDGLLERVKHVRPKRSDAEVAVEKAKADYEQRLAAAEQARVAAEERANQEILRSFLSMHAADTNDPRLAMALFGLPFVPEKTLRVENGRPVVVDKDGTALPHIDPEKYVRDTLASDALAFLRKPQGTGSGVRMAGTAKQETQKRPVPRNSSEQYSAMRDMVEQSFANAVTRSNGSR